MKRCLGNQGFTLFEMIVALGLVSIVISGLFSVYWMANNSFIRESSNSDLQYMARIAMKDISNHIIQANKVVINPDKSLNLSLSSGEVKIYLNGTNTWLYRTVSGSPQPVAEKITDVDYASVSDSNIIRITVVADDGNNRYSLTSEVMPRQGTVIGGE